MIGYLKKIIKKTITRSQIKKSNPEKQNQIISFVFKQCEYGTGS